MSKRPLSDLEPGPEQKLEILRRALIEGEESGVAGLLDMDRIKGQARASLQADNGRRL